MYQDLEQARGFSGKLLTRELAFWAIRWIIGFSLVALIVHYFPAWSWLWYVAAGLAALSFMALLVTKLVFSKQLEKTEQAVDQLHQALHVPEEGSLRNLVIGRWKLDTLIEGVKVTGVTEYNPNGTLSSQGSITSEDAVTTVSVSGKWHLEDKELIWTISQSTNPALLEPGSSKKETILSITEEEMTYRDQEGEVWTEKKVIK